MMKKKKNKNKNKPKWGVSVNVKCKYIYKDSSFNNYSYWTYKTNEYYTANQKNQNPKFASHVYYMEKNKYY